MNDWVVYIPLAAIAAFFLWYQKKNAWVFGAISWILLVYLVMATLAVVLDGIGHSMAAFDLQVEPMLYLSGCLLLGFWGLSGMRDHRLREIEIENIRLLRWFELFLIVSSFIAIAFFVPFSIKALSGDIHFNRLDLEYGQTALSAWGFVNTFCSLAANLYVFNMVFAFLNMTPGFGQGKAAQTRTMLLLVGSTSQLFYVLSYVGRDGVIFWAATFVLVYLLLRRFIPARSRRKVVAFALGVLAVSLIPFVAITVSRFESSEAGVLVSVLQYGGVQVQQFNDHYLAYSEPQWGKINFPLLYRLLPLPDPYFNKFEWFVLYYEQGVVPYTFSTYIGTFVQDVGRWATPCLVLLIALVTRSSLRGVRTRGRIRLSQLFIFVLGTQVVLYGVFYFRQGMANSYVLAVLVLALLFKVLKRRGDRRMLSRDPVAA
jgi:hypothetical protein